MTTMTTPPGLLQKLDQAGIRFELIPHRPTTSALAEAHVLGLDPEEVAKTLVLTSPDGLVRAVIPATKRLDLDKVRRVLGSKYVQLAREETLAGAYPEFELGAVPPFARPDGDLVLVDERLGDRESVVLEAGTHRRSIRLRVKDLLLLTDAQIADICRA